MNRAYASANTGSVALASPVKGVWVVIMGGFGMPRELVDTLLAAPNYLHLQLLFPPPTLLPTIAEGTCILGVDNVGATCHYAHIGP